MNRIHISLKTLSTVCLTVVVLSSALVVITMRLHMAGVLRATDAEDLRMARLRGGLTGHLAAMLSQEAALRGRLATGDRSFGKGEREHEANALAQLRDAMSPSDREWNGAALARTEQAALAWHRAAAAPQPGVAEALRAERVAFERYRLEHQYLTARTERSIGDARGRAEAALVHAQRIAVGLILALLFASAAVGRYLLRHAIVPLTRLSESIERGEFSAEVIGPSAAHEVRVLALGLAALLEAARDRALRDGLTRVYNRAFLAEQLPREMRRVKRGARLAAIMLDLDHFKQLNDRYGHAAGDDVLLLVARCLERTVRETDVVVRYGGEEFAILLPDTDEAGAMVLGERLRAAIAELGPTDGLPLGLQVTASIGAAYTADLRDPSRILSVADRALYRAKDAGRNRVVSASHILPRVSLRMVAR